jgi:hypothetical protein
MACLLAAVTPAPAVEPKEQLVRATYPVADLVIPTAESAKTARMGKPQLTLEDRLIRQIVRTIQPTTWNDNGGKGTIQYFGPTMSLVVKQTPQIQEQVADLLARLRKDQDMQVALEIRFVSISEDACERIGAEFSAPPGTGHHCRLLSDTQMSRFLEAAASDRQMCVMTAPKLTALNRQAISLKLSTGPHEWATAEPWHAKLVAEVGEPGDPNETGWHVTARPVVSGDRRFVKLSLNVEQREAKSAARKTVAVPDGGTVLIDGFRAMVQVQKECPQPVISDIPYINRLFRVVCASREPRRVFVLVTPRIVVTQEEEERATPMASGTSAVESAPCPMSQAAQPASPKRMPKAETCVVAGDFKAQEANAPNKAPAEAQELRDIARKAYQQALRIDPNCLGAYQGLATLYVTKKDSKEPSSRQAKVLAELLRAYDAACTEGCGEEAEKLARAALILDPMCFRRK